MISWWPVFEAVRFGAEAQYVVALRMMRLAQGGQRAATEARRMIGEKPLAAWTAHTAMATALLAGRRPEDAGAMAFATYRRAVRANRRRLVRSS
jgi:hypothetical protein